MSIFFQLIIFCIYVHITNMYHSNFDICLLLVLAVNVYAVINEKMLELLNPTHDMLWVNT